MNADQLSKNIGQLFRLRPMPVRLEVNGSRLPPRDDQWKLVDVREKPAGIQIRNVSTGQKLDLESDNIRERRSPDFLLLRCQLTIRADGIDIEPVFGTAPSPSNAVRDFFVYNDYPADVGIISRLEAEGYKARWVKARGEMKRSVEGWEYVEDLDDEGHRIRLKVEDSLLGYVVLMKKRDVQLQ